MATLAGSLIAASAAVVLLLGLIHLVYTFHGRRLHPRDAELEARMRDAPLVFLLCVALAMLAGYVFLCRQYFFRAPLRWMTVATVLYAGALAAAISPA